ncbi:dipeptidase E [Leucobacter luti]|uniref:Dipeptidase E n=1 Tax=Leucobacter luti TaxID=340320 RepID=A0A4R6RTT1_9MICO|nr:Type 1 glutamine amidotransferase-like domain-containing protein [Leucobacter luti]MCW2288013.1 dipeptidase E [Leucobacter luti]TCK45825.1 dipeptidase E [Leucobacter luti]TDP90280.1 dipeptidase E [Leucobacter luti]
MNLLLLSISLGAVPEFLSECVGTLTRQLRLGYISDAAEGMPFAERELHGVRDLGHEVMEIRARDADADAFAAKLSTCDAVYVAGGETFVLLEALRSNGTGEVLAQRVRAGLPYIGCSAGSVIAGPSITPVEMLDDRTLAVGLTSDEGLGLIDRVIIPHADGKIPPYPIALIERIISTYGEQFPLLTLNDDQALRVGPTGARVIPSP